MAITTWAATTGNWEDSKFSQGWDGPSISPASAALSIVPNWSIASGDWASSSQDWNVGLEPAFNFGLFANPANASLEIIQSYEWDQLTNSWVATPGTWDSGPVPQVAVGSGISPDKADLTFTAYSPVSGIMYDFKVTASTLTLTGQLPIAGDGFVIKPDNATLTIVQSYTWNNYGGTWAASSDNWDVAPFIPTAVETGQNQPDAGSLILTGIAPDPTIQKLWYVPAGSMALTGFLPISTTGHMFIPDNANLTGLGFTSWDGTSGDWASSLDNWGEGVTLPGWDAITGDWASSKDTWAEGTLIPIVGVTYTFTIDSSGNLVFTPYDPQWPLVGEPYYKPQIIIS